MTEDNGMTNRIKAYCDQWTDMVGIRAPLITLWTELAKFFMPSVETLNDYGQNATDPSHPGAPSDITGLYAAKILTSGVYSNSIGMAKRFYALQAQDLEAMKDDAIKEWWSDNSNKTMKSLQNSNFTVESFEELRKFVIFGTTIIEGEYQLGKGMKYKSFPIWQCCIAENPDKEPDTLLYEFHYTAIQVAKKWPDSHSDKVKALVKDPATRQQKVCILRIVQPRFEFQAETEDPMLMEWENTYIEKENNNILHEGGFKSFPFAIARAERIDGTPYGRSIAMEALPAARSLSRQKYDVIDATEAETIPVVFGPDDVAPADVNMRPGAYNPILKPGQAANQILAWTPKVNLQYAFNLIMDDRQQIRDLFMVDVFMAMESGMNKTATEVEERVNEKFQTLTPLVARTQTDFFSPIIVLTFNNLAQYGKLTEPPENMPAEYQVEYVSRMNALLNRAEVDAVMRSAAQVNQLCQYESDTPTMAETMNLEAAKRQICYANGVSADIVNTESETKDAKKAIEAAKQSQMIAQGAAQHIGKVDMLKAPEPGSLMGGALE